MNIGSLNKRITIQYPTKVSDAMGGFTTTWNDGDSIFAAIWPISSVEQIKSMGVTLTISHRIRIRYRKDLRSSWRLKFKDRYFDIVSITNPNMSNRMLDILCKEMA